MSPIFFNTQHSPIGAFASFTLGSKGAKGGLGLELETPANQNVFIGLEDVPGRAVCFPFFQNTATDSERFDSTGKKTAGKCRLVSLPDEQISRSLTPGSDIWNAGDISFAIHTPVMPAPDPATEDRESLQLAYVPAIAIELTIDNRQSRVPRRAFFGFQGNDSQRGIRQFDPAQEGCAGIACGFSLAIASNSAGVVSAQGFSAEDILSESHAYNYGFGIGNVGLLLATVPKKQRMTFRFAVCFYRPGVATTGLESSYLYRRLFPNIEAVARYALGNFAKIKARGKAFDLKCRRARLNPARKFMLSQAIHSYYGSTQLVEIGRRPMWIVNEGEYRMINTFDLTVDQVFFEMEMNPWTVRNELDWYVRRYSYTDRVRLPNDPREYPGGLSFTHDMGIANHFARPGHSVYEKAGIDGCHSHMTHEELTNWAICGLIYEHGSHDKKWAKRNLPVFRKILESMLNRDHPSAGKRDGVMSADSARCAGGAEITTYDSLDISLGQARNNIYLAVKCWGVYVGLAALFERLGDSKLAKVCQLQVRRLDQTICGAGDEEGFLPAIICENVPSRVIPAIEGLVIPYALGLRSALSKKGEHDRLIGTLKRHLVKALQPGICLFPNGAWKLSSTSDNSWLSKIYLCQFVAEEILQCVSREDMEKADNSHANWLLDDQNSYWAWSDQMINGIAKGSRYYPRGVTSILWLKPKRRANGKRVI